jgi:hypothetical protein
MKSEHQTIDNFRLEEFLGASIWVEDGTIHIDVSALPAPDPFVAIMKLLEHPNVGDVVVFHNDREPVHLFPELLDLGWSYITEIDQPGTFRMSIIRGSTS